MEKIKLEPGIYPGMVSDDYFKVDAVNNSLLWLLKEQSPKHVKHVLDNPPRPTDALRIGKAFHTRILEPEKFDAENIVIPSFTLNTNAGKEAFTEHVLQLRDDDVIDALDAEDMIEAKKGKRDMLMDAVAKSGMAILEQHELDCLNAMYSELKKQPAHQYVVGGLAELVIVWEDEETGILMKAKLDYVKGDECVIADVKSSMAGDFANASPVKYSRAISNYGLYQQAAVYTDGWQTLTGDVCSFLFIVCEKDAPWCTVPYELGEPSIMAGRASYRLALQTYKDCVAKDEWPGYNDGKVALIDAMVYTLRDEGIGPGVMI